MILSSDTISILKNYSVINPSVLFKPGNEIETVSPLKTIFAQAKVTETFPVECAIYELNKFLGVLSLFKEPDLDFNEKFVNITSGKQKIKYIFCEKEMIYTPEKAFPGKKVTFTNTPEVSFHFTADMLTSLMKSIQVLKLPQVAIRGDGTHISVLGISEKLGDSSDNYSVIVGESDKRFTIYFKTENLKMMTQDYVVDVSKKATTRFTGQASTYFVVGEATSRFEE